MHSLLIGGSEAGGRIARLDGKDVAEDVVIVVEVECSGAWAPPPQAEAPTARRMPPRHTRTRLLTFTSQGCHREMLGD